MSGSSFPRPEHIASLRQKIVERFIAGGVSIEVSERSANHYKCQYRFGLRLNPSHEWRELSVHFQCVERMLASGDNAELNRIVDEFLQDNFNETNKP